MGASVTPEDLRRREHLLRDLLSSSLDIGARARAADSPALAYLTELLIRRSFDELDAVQRQLDDVAPLPVPARMFPPHTDPV